MTIKYTVVHSNTHEDLALQVNALLALGWLLEGGVTISYNPLLEPIQSDHFICAQALSLTTRP